MDTDSFIFHTKTEDFYENIAHDTLKNGLTHPTVMKMIKDHLQQVSNGLFKDELGGKIMI